ncbi:TIGR04255 family protein [Methylobacterium sp. J-030]|uniref:TIGR04255 family protein n=1 Tax=Methylobacterium sp. J-030 TaxID=2836627 RepID=UPI001FBBC71C|nr:TIGR04255 family protein [Methylobacterium sp. J-030]MCJ2067947.1 TIGR04255 family protein [Methylobacterium sp. J-030]
MSSPTTVTLFRPIHDAHAILEEMIFFEFSPALEEAMPGLISLKDELKTEFPAHEILNTLKVQFTQQEQKQPELSTPEINKAAGIRLNRFGSDGIIDQNIQINQDLIGIFCRNYSIWDKIWPEQKSYIARIFAKIVGTQSFLTGIGMRWIDQFIYMGDDASYNAEDLLKTSSPYLHGRAFSSGARWHCHTGWFDPETYAGREVLNQLNLDAGLVNVDGKMSTAVTVTHTQILRVTQQPDELAAFMPHRGDGLGTLSGLMDALHDGNKRILGDLLTDSMCERISLRSRQTA